MNLTSSFTTFFNFFQSSCMGLRPKPRQRTGVLWTPIVLYESSSAAEDDSIKTKRSTEDASPLAGLGAEPHCG